MIEEIIVFVAPLLAGFVTSVTIPSIVSSVLVKYFKKKTNELSENAEIKKLEKKIDFLSNEILEIRGKKK